MIVAADKLQGTQILIQSGPNYPALPQRDEDLDAEELSGSEDYENNFL